jgi:hypothetical protein
LRYPSPSVDFVDVQDLTEAPVVFSPDGKSARRRDLLLEPQMGGESFGEISHRNPIGEARARQRGAGEGGLAVLEQQDLAVDLIDYQEVSISVPNRYLADLLLLGRQVQLGLRPEQ